MNRAAPHLDEAVNGPSPQQARNLRTETLALMPPTQSVTWPYFGVSRRITKERDR